MIPGFAFLMLAGAAQAAEELGLPNDNIARFDARVVAIVCALPGNCPQNCGGGKRQLGLVDNKGKLIVPLKNAVPFAGAAAELIDFCGKQVIADGLFSTNRGYTIFALQFVRAAPDGKWRRANRFTRKWAKANGFTPGGKEAARWFENDPRVRERIAAEGKLGLGPAVDRNYFAKQ